MIPPTLAHEAAALIRAAEQRPDAGLRTRLATPRREIAGPDMPRESLEHYCARVAAVLPHDGQEPEDPARDIEIPRSQ